MANYGLKAMYTGVPNIMEAFDSLRGNNPFYSVWYGNNMLFQFSGSDIEAGRQQLEQMLMAMDQSGNADIITIKFHPKSKGGYITNKTESTGMIPVRVVPLESAGMGAIEPSSTGLLPTPVYNMFQRLDKHLDSAKGENELLKQRIGALELAAVPDAPVKTWVDQAKEIMEIPGIADIAVKLITPILGLAGIGQQAQPNLMINGMNDVITEPKQETTPVNNATTGDIVDAPLELTDEENDTIDAALMELSNHCNIVEILPKLAKFATTENQTFNFLLGQLK